MHAPYTTKACDVDSQCSSGSLLSQTACGHAAQDARPVTGMARRAAAPAVVAFTAALFVWSAIAVTVTPDLPPAQRDWNATGNSDFINELPFNFTAEVPNGITLTTVKTAPGCAPEQVGVPRV